MAWPEHMIVILPQPWLYEAVPEEEEEKEEEEGGGGGTKPPTEYQLFPRGTS